MPAKTERSNVIVDDAARSIKASRVFDAPRELVWNAWTNVEHLSRWWGPDGFTTTTQKFDFRPGGEWVFVMHGPDGTDYANRFVYREIVEPERIVYSHVSGPLFDATAVFVPEGNKTRVTVQMVFESAELRNRVAEQFGAVEGLNQTLNHLAEELERIAAESGREFVITRTFDAPRDLMWKVWTDEQRLAKWFGPKGVTIFHSKNDLRPGGMYLYGMRSPDGSEFWGRWIYIDIEKPERLVFVISFSDPKGGLAAHPMAPEWPREWLSIVTFTEERGKTTVTVKWTTINATESQRNTFAEGRASMNQGWGGTFEQLTNYIAGAKGEPR